MKTAKDLAKRTSERNALYKSMLADGDLDAIWAVWAAARFLNLSVDTLNHRRLDGTGPVFVRLSKSKVGYRRRSLVAYIDSREFSSTSEEAAVKAGGNSLARAAGNRPGE